MKSNKKRVFSFFSLLSVSAFLVIGVIYFLSDFSPSFADYINSGLSQSFRRIMASIGGIFPFSLFQLLVILIPVFIFLVVYLAIRAFTAGRGLRFIINLASLALLIYSGHLLALGVGYNTTDILVKMEIEEKEVDKDSLTEVITLLTDEINALAPDVPRNENGTFDPGYSNEDTSERLCASYDNFESKYGIISNFDSTVKSVGAGHFMSYLGLSGIYTYYTGEANVNSDPPPQDRIFTSAHEMAHQRGILRENEANFVAYIVTVTSDDPNLRYSGSLEIFGYFASALYRTDKQAYYEIYQSLCEEAKADIRASNAVWQKYGDTVFSKISDWVNNLYLKSNGTEGIISYGRVVELVVSYHK